MESVVLLDYDKIYRISNSNNSDKYYELFWLTFKNIAIKFLNKSDIIAILKFSKELDKLQNDKKYEEIKQNISNYLKNNLDVICKNSILKKCKYGMSHISLNIKRWFCIDNLFKINNNYNEYYLKMNIINKLINKNFKNNNDKHIINIIDFFYKCEYIQTNKNIYIDMFTYGYNNNLSLLIDIVYPHITNNDILKLYNIEWNNTKYNNITGRNIIKLIKKLSKIDKK